MTNVTDPIQAPAGGGATEETSTAQAAKDQAASVASTAASEAKAVASEAAAEAKDVLADVRLQLRAQAEEQSAKVAATVGDVASQLRKMAAAGEPGPAKDLITGVADQAQQMSQRLGEGGLDRTFEDARRFARNRPGLFLAGAALAGFVTARVVRVADTDRLKQAASGSNGSTGRGMDVGPGALPSTTTSYPTPGLPATGAS